MASNMAANYQPSGSGSGSGSGMKFSKDVLASVVGGIILLAIGYVVGEFRTEARYEKKYEAAAKQYAKRLDALIADANQVDDNNLYSAARAVVSTRDDLRGSLISMAKLLNSDIDKLAENITKKDPVAIKETINVLVRKWPAKRDQIDIEYRKLLTEAGLIEGGN